MARFLTLELKTDFWFKVQKINQLFFGKSINWLVKMTHRKDSKQFYGGTTFFFFRHHHTGIPETNL